MAPFVDRTEGRTQSRDVRIPGGFTIRQNGRRKLPVFLGAVRVLQYPSRVGSHAVGRSLVFGHCRIPTDCVTAAWRVWFAVFHVDDVQRGVVARQSFGIARTCFTETARSSLRRLHRGFLEQCESGSASHSIPDFRGKGVAGWSVRVLNPLAVDSKPSASHRTRPSRRSQRLSTCPASGAVALLDV